MRRNPSARRPAPIRLIPYGSGRSAEVAVHGSLAVALDAGPPPRTRPPLGVVRPGAPDVTADARLIARLVLEVLAGVRPYHHLAGRTTPELFEHLDGFAARMRTRVFPRLGTVRVCAPAPGVAEVTAIASFGPRVHALALRLEQERGRWRCAAIETALPA
ncbi:Rv3235 family protein [Actinoallomurus rhizosphaericola]|uniref:Rv3235 family protein n=1 Tax=Actinoallomurus rhizosphaericola TaxID=2952536 RepID=UPI002093B83C|nr:Rv3235 family protein [Actinoallomurus rhizosphaericola]MCO5998764.1 Rv3235 family protein [Actinoallomurus rhizosphaericola]